MTTTSTTIEQTIVAFKIHGGGGNNRKLTYLGEHSIGEFTEDLFTAYENFSEAERKFSDDREVIEALYEAINKEDVQEWEKKYDFKLGELIYHINCNRVGLTVAQEKTGIGRIDKDGDYNTIYTCRLADCDEKELATITNDDYAAPVIVEYANNKLGR